MIQVTNPSKCSGCHACASICPKSCIAMEKDTEGFWYPKANKKACVDCGLCEKVCPVTHQWHPDEIRITTAVAAMNHKQDIRLNSSSGGIFTLLAEEIIAQGGVVFGAAFADDFKSVHHICVENVNDLGKLRGSKYVQSKIGETYRQAKEYLNSGRKVLFTGTPCQISGLYAFLRKPYEELYTQDIICHGVPSPMVWEKYVAYRECLADAKTQQMRFRYKKDSWRAYEILFDFKNGKSYGAKVGEDLYMKAFLSNACLRPSCYDCAFKGIVRQADLTLADFWGIEKVLPEMDDDKGTSLVLVHSEKGSRLFQQIQNRLRSCGVRPESALQYNSAAVQSAAPFAKRNAFLHDIQNQDFECVVSKYTRKTFIQRMMSRLRSGIKKIKGKLG